MRKVCFVVLAICLSGISSYGCSKAPEPVLQTENVSGMEFSEAQEDNVPEPEAIGEPAVSSIKPETQDWTQAAQGGPFGRISLSIPSGWAYQVYPADSDELINGMYGIHFYPEEEPEGFIELAYTDFWGVCGTGLESKSAEIAGNPASMGTYDGHKYWDFISFQGEYEGIVALASSVENWEPENFSQVVDILNTLSFLPAEKEGGAYIYHTESEISALGLSFSLKNISPAGATIIFDQYDPDAPTGELDFGSDFALEVLADGKWEAVPVALEGKYGFDSIAYMIAAGERTECELDWEWLYGELPAGEYRVEKAVHDFRGTGDFDEYTVYAHFVLN